MTRGNRRFDLTARTEIVDRYLKGHSVASLARAFQCAKDTINRVLWESGVKKPGGARRPTYNPTAEEIEAGTAEVREEWDEKTCRRRAGLSSKKKPYEFPVYHISVSRADGIVMDRLDETHQ